MRRTYGTQHNSKNSDGGSYIVSIKAMSTAGGVIAFEESILTQHSYFLITKSIGSSKESQRFT